MSDLAALLHETLAVALAQVGIVVENVGSIGNAEQYLLDYETTDRLLAELAKRDVHLAANVRVGDAGLDVERLAAAIHLGKRHNALSCQHIEDRSDAAAIAREYAALAESKPK